jgi:hypothetical protein
VNEPSIAAAPKARHPWHQAIALPPWPGAAEAFDGAIQALIDEFGAEEIWVFGSWRRREAHTRHRFGPDGCAIGTAGLPATELGGVAGDSAPPQGVRHRPLITPELWSQRRLRPNGVYLDVVRHGIRVYARRPQ